MLFLGYQSLCKAHLQHGITKKGFQYKINWGIRMATTVALFEDFVQLLTYNGKVTKITMRFSKVRICYITKINLRFYYKKRYWTVVSGEAGVDWKIINSTG